jgi:hypothetical protein
VPDPSWFYSSLSQVTAAIVGFLGGFLVLRVHGITARWQELVTQLDTLESAWQSAENAIRQKGRRQIAVLPNEEMEEGRLFEELRKADREAVVAAMPTELLWAACVLVALLAVGGLWPLLTLGSPSNRIQAGFLGPFSLLVLAFTGLQYWELRRALKKLKAFRLMKYTRRRIDEADVSEEARLWDVPSPSRHSTENDAKRRD